METVEIANLLDGVRFDFVCKINYAKLALMLFCAVLCFKTSSCVFFVLVLQTAEYPCHPSGLGDF